MNKIKINKIKNNKINKIKGGFVGSVAQSIVNIPDAYKDNVFNLLRYNNTNLIPEITSTLPLNNVCIQYNNKEYYVNIYFEDETNYYSECDGEDSKRLYIKVFLPDTGIEIPWHLTLGGCCNNFTASKTLYGGPRYPGCTLAHFSAAKTDNAHEHKTYNPAHFFPNYQTRFVNAFHITQKYLTKKTYFPLERMSELFQTISNNTQYEKYILRNGNTNKNNFLYQCGFTVEDTEELDLHLFIFKQSILHVFRTLYYNYIPDTTPISNYINLQPIVNNCISSYNYINENNIIIHRNITNSTFNNRLDIDYGNNFHKSCFGKNFTDIDKYIYNLTNNNIIELHELRTNINNINNNINKINEQYTNINQNLEDLGYQKIHLIDIPISLINNNHININTKNTIEDNIDNIKGYNFDPLKSKINELKTTIRTNKTELETFKRSIKQNKILYKSNSNSNSNSDNINYYKKNIENNLKTNYWVQILDQREENCDLDNKYKRLLENLINNELTSKNIKKISENENILNIIKIKKKDLTSTDNKLLSDTLELLSDKCIISVNNRNTKINEFYKPLTLERYNSLFNKSISDNSFSSSKSEEEKKQKENLIISKYKSIKKKLDSELLNYDDGNSFFKKEFKNEPEVYKKIIIDKLTNNIKELNELKKINTITIKNLFNNNKFSKLEKNDSNNIYLYNINNIKTNLRSLKSFINTNTINKSDTYLEDTNVLFTKFTTYFNETFTISDTKSKAKSKAKSNTDRYSERANYAINEWYVYIQNNYQTLAIDDKLHTDYDLFKILVPITSALIEKLEDKELNFIKIKFLVLLVELTKIISQILCYHWNCKNEQLLMSELDKNKIESRTKEFEKKAKITAIKENKERIMEQIKGIINTENNPVPNTDANTDANKKAVRTSSRNKDYANKPYTILKQELESKIKTTTKIKTKKSGEISEENKDIDNSEIKKNPKNLYYLRDCFSNPNLIESFKNKIIQNLPTWTKAIEDKQISDFQEEVIRHYENKKKPRSENPDVKTVSDTDFNIFFNNIIRNIKTSIEKLDLIFFISYGNVNTIESMEEQIKINKEKLKKYKLILKIEDKIKTLSSEELKQNILDIRNKFNFIKAIYEIRNNLIYP